MEENSYRYKVDYHETSKKWFVYDSKFNNAYLKDGWFDTEEEAHSLACDMEYKFGTWDMS